MLLQVGEKNDKKREGEEKKIDSPQHIFVLRRGTFQYYSKELKTLESSALQLYILIRLRRTLDDSRIYNISILSNETKTNSMKQDPKNISI